MNCDLEALFIYFKSSFIWPEFRKERHFLYFLDWHRKCALSNWKSIENQGIVAHAQKVYVRSTVIEKRVRVRLIFHSCKDPLESVLFIHPDTHSVETRKSNCEVDVFSLKPTAREI